MKTKPELEKIIKEIAKKFGDDVIKRGSESKVVDVISTGLSSVDYIIGGGVPKGRITEIWGNKASGKTSLCLNIAKECQKIGGQVVFIDVEQTFDKSWASFIGVNCDDVILIQPENAESSLEIMNQFIQPEVDLIIFDSIAALSPIREIEKPIGDPTVGETARLMGVAMRKFTVPARKNDVALVFINQVRDKIGGYAMYGTPETTPGGRAIAFHASLRISLKSGEWIKNGTEQIGNLVTAKIEKSKVGKPSGQTKYAFYYNCEKQGKECEECTQIHCSKKLGPFDSVSDLFTTAVYTKIIERSGPMYKFGENSWKGQDAAKETILSDEKLIKEIRTAVNEITRKKL